MRYIKAVTRHSFIISLAMMLAISVTAPAIEVAADPTCTPPSASEPGVHQPTGSDASTYTYVCDPTSPYYQEYVNAYYVFNPETDVATPLYTLDYTYNCTTGVWTVNNWSYDPASGKFVESEVTTSAPSGQSTNCPTTSSSSGSSNPSDSSDPTDSSDNGIANSGPNSDNTTGLNVDNNVNADTTNTAAVNNNLNSSGSSGDASVIGNTTGGNATSGDVSSEADIINMLQSSSNALGTGSNVITFTYNVNGDVNGNLLLNPADLSSIQNAGPNSTNTDSTNLNNNVVVNTANSGAINNNVNLDADSGNATVSSNTTGGNATSGSASTIANVVNMIDSAVAAGQSFIGTININGDLNGNIEIPADFVSQLLADNVPTVTLTGPSSTNNSSTTVNNNQTVTNTNNEGINNNVTGNASSGSANVSDNTTGGNATSGDATTSITAFNLTGSQVIGANDLLVFVNVSGSWVGLILNAPAGTTAAELGGGITSSGPNSSNSTNTDVNNNSSLTNTNNGEINNNINSNASSGSANVSDNTTGGNATSGDADNSVNLLNVENSSLNLSNWFGILFINVFGTWNGSFVIAPNPTTADNTTNGAAQSGSAPLASFQFKSGGSSSNFDVVPFSTGSTSVNNGSSIEASLIKSVKNDSKAPTPKLASGHFNWLLAVSGASLFVIISVGDRLYALALRRLHSSRV